MCIFFNTVETRYNEILGTKKSCLLYQIQWNLVITRTLGPWKLPCYIRFLLISGWKNKRNTKSWDQQNYLVITGFCYIRPLYNEVPLYFVISVVNKQYKTKEINSLGLEKLVCYIRYFVISDLFISSFHCIVEWSRLCVTWSANFNFYNCTVCMYRGIFIYIKLCFLFWYINVPFIHK